MSTPQPQTGFSYNIDCRPDFAFLTVRVPANETLKVEGSAMAAMSTNMKMKTKMRGGFSRLLTGESLFINEFTAAGGPGEIQIAPGSPGDMAHVALQNQTMYLQNSAYVASSMGINVESKWQGVMKGFFSGESLFLIRCSGSGDLWFNTYGAMIEIDVNGTYVVDTGYIVAFTEGLDYQVTRVGGYKALFFSGEGLVCRFSGRGKLWIQTRQIPWFGHWIWPFRPEKKSND
ncbi:MAG: TIGR00266 family protein [Thermoanaerobaculia bacterium]